MQACSQEFQKGVSWDPWPSGGREAPSHNKFVQLSGSGLALTIHSRVDMIMMLGLWACSKYSQTQKSEALIHVIPVALWTAYTAAKLLQ